MLDKVIHETKEYIKAMPKELRKTYGQFFTSKESALFMASIFDIPLDLVEISILDPGAGSGILACALLERIQTTEIQTVHLTCYENDDNVLPLLEQNLKTISKQVKFNLIYEIKTKNYILDQENDYNGKPMLTSRLNLNDNSHSYKGAFDLVICNPPYKKVSKSAPEALALNNVCYGAPNLYFLFLTMSIFNSKKNGELVYIIPRSWTSGAYFAKFREYLFANCYIEQMHLFVSRNKVFENESVLQETMIIRLKKSALVNEEIKITSSQNNSDFHDIQEFSAPRTIVFNGKNNYVYLITKKEDSRVLEVLNQWNDTLETIGLKMKTGLVVDFRNREYLRNENTDGAIPLLFSQNIINGKIIFPIEKDIQYVIPAKKGFMQANTNYLLVKRFTAKEEKRRIQCGIYLSNMCPTYEYISTQNKVNFITGITRNLTEKSVYGLYVLFNSTLYDEYYRILNGSTQVNSTEINTMPVPDFATIELLGTALKNKSDLNTETCDEILENLLGE